MVVNDVLSDIDGYKGVLIDIMNVDMIAMMRMYTQGSLDEVIIKARMDILSMHTNEMSSHNNSSILDYNMNRGIYEDIFRLIVYFGQRIDMDSTNTSIRREIEAHNVSLPAPLTKLYISRLPTNCSKNITVQSSEDISINKCMQAASFVNAVWAQIDKRCKEIVEVIRRIVHSIPYVHHPVPPSRLSLHLPTPSMSTMALSYSNAQSLHKDEQYAYEGGPQYRDTTIELALNQYWQNTPQRGHNMRKQSNSIFEKITPQRKLLRSSDQRPLTDRNGQRFSNFQIQLNHSSKKDKKSESFHSNNDDKSAMITVPKLNLSLQQQERSDQPKYSKTTRTRLTTSRSRNIKDLFPLPSARIRRQPSSAQNLGDFSEVEEIQIELPHAAPTTQPSPQPAQEQQPSPQSLPTPTQTSTYSGALRIVDAAARGEEEYVPPVLPVFERLTPRIERGGKLWARKKRHQKQNKSETDPVDEQISTKLLDKCRKSLGLTFSPRRDKISPQKKRANSQNLYERFDSLYNRIDTAVGKTDPIRSALADLKLEWKHDKEFIDVKDKLLQEEEIDVVEAL